MAVLSIGWSSLPARPVAPEAGAVTPSDANPADRDKPADPAAEKPALARVKHADKPMLVYIAEPGAAEATFDKVEKVVLTDDKVVVGTWAFRCVRMTPEQASQNDLLKDAGKETPRIVFIATDWKTVKVVEGSKLSVGGLWSEMQAQFKKCYEGNLETNVKAMLKVLGEFDKIANQRKVLDAEKERTEKPTAADEAKWKKESAELDAAEKAANAKKAELMKFVKKGEEAAAA